MKKWIVVFACILFTLVNSTINAQEYSFSSSMYSQYLGVNGGIFLDDADMQSAFDINWDNGIYTGIWWAVGMDDTDLSSNFGDEVDVKVGWTNSSNNWNWDIGFLYLMVTPLQTTHNDFASLYADLSYKLTESLSVYGRYEGYRHVATSDVNDGQFFFSGLKYNTAMGKWNLSARATLAWDDGAFSNSSGMFWSGDVSVSHSLIGKTCWMAGAKFADQLSTHDSRESEIAYHVGISVTF